MGGVREGGERGERGLVAVGGLPSPLRRSDKNVTVPGMVIVASSLSWQQV